MPTRADEILNYMVSVHFLNLAASLFLPSCILSIPLVDPGFPHRLLPEPSEEAREEGEESGYYAHGLARSVLTMFQALSATAISTRTAS